MKYVDSIKGGGDPTIPFGECFRLRTRTGHQILMHNSEDLIYIGNSKGTAWIELTSNGKIDIYANDSISIHTQQDLNIRADRDINLEAGRNINMRAAGESAGGNIQIECKKDLNLLVGQNGSITTIQDFNLNAGKSNKFTAGTTTEIKSGGNHIETASKIHMNGPAAGTATKVVALTVHNNVVVDAVTVPWKSKRYQSDKMLESIMYRIPMHEPWGGHENYDPTLVTPDKTDRDQ
jgi:uncharacterized protein (DUF2345 family)